MAATPLGSQQLTVSATAVGLTVPGPSGGIPGPNFAVIRCSTANVRFDDNTSPTSAAGVPLLATEILKYDGSLGAVKFIRSSTADATLDIAYYRVS